ncbi:PucR family transcriptional regulator [Sciscionella marina]|uniref:PucR family transcriptional regulator n=1 Tax=Sciscionella marina TaxID=508770 RepID=UPI000367675D|nr:helix-turn-helix domain-containing protein [Sciscionella marina]
MAAREARKSDQPRGGLSATTLRAIERASGEFATSAVEEMQRRLPWFTKMTADQRASVKLVVQTGAAGFVEWFHDPRSALRMTVLTFRGAPRDLSRWVSLRQTVELVRVAIEVYEEHIPSLARDDAERDRLTEAVLRYGREVAFAAATSYAAAAESRGAWDARLEALVVDGIVRGDAEETLLSRAAALGWAPGAPATVIVGGSPSEDQPTMLYEVRNRAARTGRPVLIGVQGERLVVVLGGPIERPTELEDLNRMAEVFAEGPVIAGPTVPRLAEAHRSAAEALSGLRAVAGWPSAPRPVRAVDLLPERALDGDGDAQAQLVEQIARPLEDSGGALLETVQTYLEAGGVLESCARQLYVHPNTVRYRLKRTTELTGRNPLDARDAHVLRIALTVGRLGHS